LNSKDGKALDAISRETGLTHADVKRAVRFVSSGSRLVGWILPLPYWKRVVQTAAFAGFQVVRGSACLLRDPFWIETPVGYVVGFESAKPLRFVRNICKWLYRAKSSSKNRNVALCTWPFATAAQ